MNNFYIYVILNLDEPGIFEYNDIKFDYMPIYIGKGINKRQFTHFKPYSLKKDSEKNKFLLKYNCISKIIKDGLAEIESLNLERYYIKLIGRVDIKTGPLLNLTSGGQGVCGYQYTEDQKLDRSLKQRCDKNHFYNKNHNVDTFKEFKRSVYQINIITDEIIDKFDSLSDAAIKTNSNESHIRDCCNGKRKTHNGFKWKDVDDNYIKKRSSKNNSTNKREILQIDLDGNIIEKYDSISSCSRITGIRKSNIIDCLSNRKRTAGGFKWSYNESIIMKFSEMN